ncbi:MAG: CRISPR-associated endonuclease Cas2 [Casimicrobiaceae bacterium]
MPQHDFSENAPWLIAYDIADPRRLSRIGRLAQKHAIRLQYSVYLHLGSDAEFDRFWSLLAAEIDPVVDDVRAWRLTSHCLVWTCGRHPLPADVLIDANTIVRKLLHGDEALTTSISARRSQRQAALVS